MTGVGAFRQRDIVHQHSQNDWRELPVSGIPLGALQGGFMWLNRYQRELGQTTFPSDGAKTDPYPLYDRWGDSFNTTTELFYKFFTLFCSSFAQLTIFFAIAAFADAVIRHL